MKRDLEARFLPSIDQDREERCLRNKEKFLYRRRHSNCPRDWFSDRTSLNCVCLSCCWLCQKEETKSMNSSRIRESFFSLRTFNFPLLRFDQVPDVAFSPIASRRENSPHTNSIFCGGEREKKSDFSCQRSYPMKRKAGVEVEKKKRKRKRKKKKKKRKRKKVDIGIH